jgi:hypothetical protein
MRSVVTLYLFISYLANASSSEFFFDVTYSVGVVDDCSSPISGRVVKLDTCTPAALGGYEIVEASLNVLTRTLYGDALCENEVISNDTPIKTECSNGVKNFVSPSFALPYPVQHIGVRQVDCKCSPVLVKFIIDELIRSCHKAVFIETVPLSQQWYFVFVSPTCLTYLDLM